jgi:hypothetical protein
MKKVQKSSALICVIAFFVLNIVCIPSSQAQFSIGIKAAANAANYLSFTQRNFGWDAGVFLRLGDRFYFQPEVNYVFKRSTLTEDAGDANTGDVVKQHYVSVPALLGYHFINNENFKFHLTLGPRFDFKVADNFKDNPWQSGAIQWGGQVGLGIDFWRFTLDFGYYIAADNFRNTETAETQTKMANAFVVGLGFKFIK